MENYLSQDVSSIKSFESKYIVEDCVSLSRCIQTRFSFKDSQTLTTQTDFREVGDVLLCRDVNLSSNFCVLQSYHKHFFDLYTSKLRQ